MSSAEISMENIIEDEDEDSFVSNTNAIIYAASDISGWTQSLISDNNIPNSSSSTSVDEHHHHYQQISTAAGSGGDDDDSMIVSSSASSGWFMNNQQEIRIFNVDFRALCDDRLKSGPGSEFRGNTGKQETIVRLVNTLMACAEAIQENNLSFADVLISDIRRLTVSQIGGAMKKVAIILQKLSIIRFTERIHKISLNHSILRTRSCIQLYESCPLLKIAHFTANQSILEAFADSKRVHVIDFSFNQGFLWTALLQALALRPGGPPAFRRSGISVQPKSDDNSDPLQEVGFKLVQLAEATGVEFEFRGFMAHETTLDILLLLLRVAPRCSSFYVIRTCNCLCCNTTFYNLLFPSVDAKLE